MKKPSREPLDVLRARGWVPFTNLSRNSVSVRSVLRVGGVPFEERNSVWGPRWAYLVLRACARKTYDTACACMKHFAALGDEEHRALCAAYDIALLGLSLPRDGREKERLLCDLAARFVRPWRFTPGALRAEARRAAKQGKPEGHDPQRTTAASPAPRRAPPQD